MKKNAQWISATAVIMAAVIAGLFSLLSQQKVEDTHKFINIEIDENDAEISIDNSITNQTNRIVNNINFSSDGIEEKNQIIKELNFIFKELRGLKDALYNRDLSVKAAEALKSLGVAKTSSELKNAINKSKDLLHRSEIKKANCEAFNSENTDGCTSCFNGGILFEGKVARINDTMTNNGTSLVIYYIDENEKVFTATNLQTGHVKMLVSKDMYELSDNLLASRDENGRKFLFFEPKTSTGYLKARKGAGFKLTQIGSNTDFSSPALRFTLHAKVNYAFRGAGETHGSKTINNCTFYFAENPAS